MNARFDHAARARTGGFSLVAATVLFIAVFSYLAAIFAYPDVLSQPADEVLPALLRLGGIGRLVWWIYGLIPLLLIPAGRGIAALARATAPRLAPAALWFASASAVSMMAGLLRRPTLQWSLAEQWVTASPAARAMIADRFGTANLYLGNVIGEFAGELFLNAFFLIAAIVVARADARRQWLAWAGAFASGLGWVAMLRNLTTVVAVPAAVNNGVLPLWMLTLGLALATLSGPTVTSDAAAATSPAAGRHADDLAERATERRL